MIDGVLMEMMLVLVQDCLGMQPNGAFFIQFRETSLSLELSSNHFLLGRNMKNMMDLRVIRDS
jgi:hypothetical protein